MLMWIKVFKYIGVIQKRCDFRVTVGSLLLTDPAFDSAFPVRFAGGG